MLLDVAKPSARCLSWKSLRHIVSIAGMIWGATLPDAIAASPPVDPAGYWSTRDDESIMRISPCTKPEFLCGTMVWLKDPLEDGAPKTDENNPDKTKRSRPLIGLEILTELVADGDHWKGKAYNAEDGKVYDITFKVLPDKVKGDKAEITGCVLRYLCKSETFTKVQTVPGGDPTLPPPVVAPVAPIHPALTTPKAPPLPAHSH